MRHESSAVASLRTINTAQISYNSAYPTVGFASTMGALGGTTCTPPDSTSACLIDTALAGGDKSGYSFTLANNGSSGTPVSAYQVLATPKVANQTGVRYFCSFADGVVRSNGSTALTLAGCDNTVTPLQ